MSSSSSSSSWLSVSYRPDPLTASLQGQEHSHYGVLSDSQIVVLKCPVNELLSRLCRNHQAYAQAILHGGRVAHVAVTDFLIRSFSTLEHDETALQYAITLERLDQQCTTTAQQQQYHGVAAHLRRRVIPEPLPPYLLERTDVTWAQNEFTWYLRVGLWQLSDTHHHHHHHHHYSSTKTDKVNGSTTDTTTSKQGNFLSFPELEQQHLTDMVIRLMNEFLSTTAVTTLLTHVAVAVCQDLLRQALVDAGGVAFVAQGSILPRKSGASAAPMSSPPALAFCAPPDSPRLNRTLTIDLGPLRPFVDLAGTTTTTRTPDDRDNQPNTKLSLQGLFVPSGVTLICGGGYHGKSTLLRCIAAGVYNKIPGDGREYSVTRTDALTVRAEDGRYVQNCNISAFISNLPSLPGTETTVDTQHFSTREASGSTSQAANVVEALELGCKVMLVDEDVSAANFMARDGRMRALVMDESITPLLYRVNGLYNTHGVSSIVVVGGVGDWLDVPHQVLLMDKYRCTDATAKAQSVSRQFSHGHVQYAGRGVVHRLPWDRSGTPIPRRPTDVICKGHDFTNRHVALLDGGRGLALYRASAKGDSDASESSMDDEEEDPWIDMSRCEQLLGRKPQLYGCGLAALAIFRLARKHPEKGLAALLQAWDGLVDQQGLFSQLQADDVAWETTVVSLGTALRPRALEVGQAICRLRGVEFEELPVRDDGAEAAVHAEEERKKKALLDMWNNRRKK